MDDLINELSAKTNIPVTEISDAFEAIKNIIRNAVDAIKTLSKTLSEFFITMREESKPKSISPKQYGMSLVRDCCIKNKKHNFYKVQPRVQRHLPYQRRSY